MLARLDMTCISVAVDYTCLVCRATGYNWHDLGFVPAPHADHDDFLVRCNPCGVTFTFPTFLECHYSVHVTTSPYFRVPPNSSTTSSSNHNVLRSESTPIHYDQRTNVSSLPPGQRPPLCTSTQASAKPLYLRQLLNTTFHLVWLSASSARQLSLQPDMTFESFMRQANLAITAPAYDVNADFRRRLATDFPASLANAERMPLPDIARATTSLRALAHAGPQRAKRIVACVTLILRM